VLVGAKLGGVVGALGAIPIASAIQIVTVDLIRARRAGLLPDEPL
jgi:predicted PurR-regulated permease PerM